MSEKRYYKKEYEEEYYIFDSKTLSEKEFEKKVEYDGYDVFADSLTPEEIIDLLNENEKLKKENSQLKQEKKELNGRYWVYVKELEKVNEMLEDEIVMLKTTIARNEAYIQQLTHKGGWKK